MIKNLPQGPRSTATSRETHQGITDQMEQRCAAPGGARKGDRQHVLTISSGHSAGLPDRARGSRPRELLHRRGRRRRAARSVVRPRRRGPRPRRRGRPPGHEALFKSLHRPARRRGSARPADWAEARTLGRPPRRYAGRRTRRPRRCSTPSRTRHPSGAARFGCRPRAAHDTPVAFHRRDVLRPEVDHRRARRVRGAGGRRPDAPGDTDAADAWAAHRHAVEAAIWAGNAAALDYLTRTAPATPGSATTAHRRRPVHRRARLDRRVVLPARLPRPRPAAAHPQRDPQPGPVHRRGVAHRSTPARSTRYRGGAGAIAERVTEEHLTRSLGLRFAHPPGRQGPGGRRRAGAEVMELFSTRRRAITGEDRPAGRRFRARFGREPNPLELDRLQRQATFATRRAKSHDGETLDAAARPVGPRAAGRGRRRAARRSPHDVARPPPGAAGRADVLAVRGDRDRARRRAGRPSRRGPART